MGKIIKDTISNIFYDRFNKTVFLICLCSSLTLLIISWIMPPKWIIHPSVLTATGEIFAFASLAQISIAIDKGLDTKVKKGDVEVEIKNK